MLNGIEPLLVITLKNKTSSSLTPGLFDVLADVVGIPIPIYLSERPVTGNVVNDLRPDYPIPQLSGIFIDSETRSLDVATKVDPVSTKGLSGETEDAIVSQTCLDSQLTINLFSKRDNTILSVLIAVLDQIIKRLVSGEYSISYFNKSTVIFGALLHRFATSVNSNDDLVKIELTLSTAAKETPTAKTPIESIPKLANSVHP